MRASNVARTIAVLAAWAMACSSSSSNIAAKTNPEAGVDGSAEAGEAGVSRPDDTTSAADRNACKYAAGDLPAKTLGPATPIGAMLPIDNIVVVMMENHSFDNYFSHLNAYAHRSDIESEPDNASNPDAMGNPQPAAHAAHLCSVDTDHGWSATHKQIHGGKMDGFFVTNDGYTAGAMLPSNDPSLTSGARSLWWYDERDLPFYYMLASTFAIADHNFASVPGPTWPNRRFLYSGTSFGTTFNDLTKFPDLSGYPFPGNKPASILDQLETSGTSWMAYSDATVATLQIVYGFSGANRWGRTVTGKITDFLTAAQNGKLPAVSFVDPDLTSELTQGGNALDEHPPGDIQNGEKFVSDIVHGLMAGPQWPHLALFVTWDEHGGFYDHLPPPPACAPDTTAPILETGDTTQAGFDLYGVRVPLLVVSPYAKAGYVGHRTYDHTSITRFIQARFGLPALTARDANAEPPTDLFDFGHPAFATPPTLPDASIDPAGLAYCKMIFGG